MFSQDDLTKLINAGPGIGVSLFLPTKMVGRETLQNPIMMKNLLAQALAKLDASGIPRSEADVLLGPAMDLLENFAFWQHQEHGLAVFISADGMKSFKLPIPVAELAVVGEGFHITPLLVLQDMNAPFVVLTATADETHVYQATRFAMTAVDIDDLPVSLKAMDLPLDYESPLQSGGYGRPNTGGQNMPKTQVYGDSPEEWRKGRLIEYVRRIAASLAAYLAGQPKDVVVIADAELGGHLARAEALSAVIAGFVEVNPASQDSASLHAAACKVMQPIHAKPLDEALERLDAMLGCKDATGSTDPVALIAAAHTGQVDILFVAEGASLSGTFDAETGATMVVEDGAVGARDLINLMAQLSLRNGGVVTVLAPDRLPDDRVMAAILRY